MATLATQKITRTGITPAYAAATSGAGDKFTPSGETFLHIKNASGSPIIALVHTVGKVRGDLDIGEFSIPVDAGDSTFAGPFPAGAFVDPADGLTVIQYDSVTSVTIGAFRLPSGS